MNSRAFFLWSVLVFLTLVIMLLTSPDLLRFERKKTVLRNSHDDLFEKVDTFAGVVEQVHLFKPGTGQDTGGVCCSIRTGSRVVKVYLGPVWYLCDNNIRISSADSVTVTGVSIEQKGEQLVLASSVKSGMSTYYFRNRHGVPRWHAKTSVRRLHHCDP